MELRFEIPGRPVTWQRTNRVGARQVKSREQRAAIRLYRATAQRALPPGWPTDAEYAVEVVGYWPDRRYGDTDRLVSHVLDALERAAYVADRQVSCVAGVRRLDRERPRVEVTVVPCEPGADVEATLAIGGAV